MLNFTRNDVIIGVLMGATTFLLGKQQIQISNLRRGAQTQLLLKNIYKRPYEESLKNMGYEELNAALVNFSQEVDFVNVVIRM